MDYSLINDATWPLKLFLTMIAAELVAYLIIAYLEDDPGDDDGDYA